MTTRIGQWEAKLLVSNPGDVMAGHYMAGERNLIQACLSRISHGDVAWDVGANVGHWSMFLAAAVGGSGTVISFEPNPTSAERLRLNYVSNEFDGYQIETCGLSNESYAGKLNIGTGGVNPRASMQRVFSDDSTVSLNLEVADDLVSASKVPTPNFVKIDVEGMEDMVVGGMTEILQDMRLKTVMCECNPELLEKRHVKIDYIADRLESHGFKVQRINRVAGSDIHLLATR